MKALPVLLGLILAVYAARAADPAAPAKLPADLVAVADATYAPLDKLAEGSKVAQEAQKTAVAKLGLPLEVKSAKSGIAFRLIPAGTFTMGSPKSEQDAAIAGVPAVLPEEAKEGLASIIKGEVPHPVTLTKAYYCGKYPITQGQWEAVMGTTPAYFEHAGKDAPVEQVSWDDCQAFLTKLCTLEGVPAGTYRLLTEGEWEYACRAGTATARYNGELALKGEHNDPALDLIAWYGGNSGVTYDGGVDASQVPGKQYAFQRAGTHSVGQKMANAYGLYDMIGNVWQWCGDWHGEYPTNAVRDPKGAAAGGARVGRGGGWDLHAGDCRAAHRRGSAPGDRYGDLGFRVLRLPPGQ